jgi:hypothetical protein
MSTDTGFRRATTTKVKKKVLGGSMGSNNYAEVITDLTKARVVLADFERLAVQGSTFTRLEFNADVDRFPIFGGRESNFPCLQDVEEGGAAVAGLIAQALWSRHGDTVEAVDFGNGHVGLFYESDGLGHMVIPNYKTDGADPGRSRPGSKPDGASMEG